MPEPHLLWPSINNRNGSATAIQNYWILCNPVPAAYSTTKTKQERARHRKIEMFFIISQTSSARICCSMLFRFVSSSRCFPRLPLWHLPQARWTGSPYPRLFRRFSASIRTASAPLPAPNSTSERSRMRNDNAKYCLVKMRAITATFSLSSWDWWWCKATPHPFLSKHS